MKVSIWVLFRKVKIHKFFNMYFLSLIQVFTLNVFYNVFKKKDNT
jgi:hypothetical protein